MHAAKRSTNSSIFEKYLKNVEKNVQKIFKFMLKVSNLHLTVYKAIHPSFYGVNNQNNINKSLFFRRMFAKNLSLKVNKIRYLLFFVRTNHIKYSMSTMISLKVILFVYLRFYVNTNLF